MSGTEETALTAPDDEMVLKTNHASRAWKASLKSIYYNPLTQVVLLGLVCFMGPGMFNALNGLGGAGQLDTSTSSNANTAVYATFAVSAFFSGSINNKLGPRTTLFLGTIGYAVYIGAFLALNMHSNLKSFVIAAGALDGLCAGPLWTAQGSLMLTYPTENQTGFFIGLFWSVYNIGGVVGAAVSLGRNFHSAAGSIDNETYIGFLVFSCIGVIIPLFMADPVKMIRSDGSKVVTPVCASWKAVFLGLWLTFKEDPAIFLLFPMFFASNWFYTWQFNDYNGALFTIRVRSLNSLLYWLVQMVGSVPIGKLLDNQHLTRRFRAFAGWVLLLVAVFVVHVWAYFYQRTYTRESVKLTSPIDITDKEYVAHLWLYILCALLDAMWQTTTYWMLSAISSDPSKLAFLIGFYKSLQSAGAAGVWRAGAIGIPYMNIFLSTWVPLVSGLIFILPMLVLRVTNHPLEGPDAITMESHVDAESEGSPKAKEGEAHV